MAHVRVQVRAGCERGEDGGRCGWRAVVGSTSTAATPVAVEGFRRFGARRSSIAADRPLIPIHFLRIPLFSDLERQEAGEEAGSGGRGGEEAGGGAGGGAAGAAGHPGGAGGEGVVAPGGGHALRGGGRRRREAAAHHLQRPRQLPPPRPAPGQQCDCSS